MQNGPPGLSHAHWMLNQPWPLSQEFTIRQGGDNKPGKRRLRKLGLFFARELSF